MNLRNLSTRWRLQSRRVKASRRPWTRSPSHKSHVTVTWSSMKPLRGAQLSSRTNSSLWAIDWKCCIKSTENTPRHDIILPDQNKIQSPPNYIQIILRLLYLVILHLKACLVCQSKTNLSHHVTGISRIWEERTLPKKRNGDIDRAIQSLDPLNCYEVARTRFQPRITIRITWGIGS